ncbi:MAG: PHP domain-containing protein [Candidatus Nanoarchaeia archaeon]|nr:PHP domain-containing protein [Candidatus Nanoarchaeia archaeon]
MLKADFHIHTNYIQKKEGRYTPGWLIKDMAKKGFNVLALTEHASINSLFVKKNYDNAMNTYFRFKDYAKKKNILLIKGVEKHIEGKEVLILNYDKFKEINNFNDLEKVRDENGLIIAPHPFYPWGLGKDLTKNIKLFDALEYSTNYIKEINFFNKKAEKVAKENKRTLLANSDAHWKFQLGNNYNIIDADLKVDSILEAVRKNKVKIFTKPLTLPQYMFITAWVLESKTRKTLMV